MALLTPNATFQMNGVTVKEKIIPDGTRWQDATKAKAAGFAAGDLYKKQQKLSGNTGKVQWITIHNTADLSGVDDDAEQYTRATYPNENMGSCRVHYYVDDNGAWQNLKAGTGLCANDPVGSAEVSWHSGDGSIVDGGNMTSLSIEVVMSESAAHDAVAKDNAARIAAWLLNKHGLTIDRLVSHTYWVNKSAGKSFSDVDKQCTNMIPGQKWCPTYIFASTNADTALKNWKAFKETVKNYMNGISGSSNGNSNTNSSNSNSSNGGSSASSAVEVSAGKKLNLQNVNLYGSSTSQTSVGTKSGVYYVWSSDVANSRIRITNSLANVGVPNQVTGWINYSDAIKSTGTASNSATTFASYTIRVTTDALNIRKGAGTNYASVGVIKDKGIYTIVDEDTGAGATKWGLLKSYASGRNGWISLDYCKKV